MTGSTAEGASCQTAIVPELPDIDVYVERLLAIVGGGVLHGVRVQSPFVLRTVSPAVDECAGRAVIGVERLGKRIVLELSGDLFVVIHLMVAGRLRWKPTGAKGPDRGTLAAFDFEEGALILSEASKKKRASLALVSGRDGLEGHDRGGTDPLACDLESFSQAIRRENRTLKRALTDQRLISGIGNAYSDEILFHSKLTPTKLTSKLTDEEVARLYEATAAILAEWRARLRDEVGAGFPDKVTAFREDFYVHGRYRKPCRVCGHPIQRIRYAENEVNYCAECQHDGKLLADRALSRLLKRDWPTHLVDLDRKRSLK